MRLFEYEAKEILRRYGIRVPLGSVAESSDEAAMAAERIGGPVALKAQVLVSGRGKAGGILCAQNHGEARTVAERLLGSSIKGMTVGSLLVEEKLNLAEQYYASVTIDRQARRYVVLASTDGGVDIEEVASGSPDRIARHWVDPLSSGEDGIAEAVMAKLPGLPRKDAAEYGSLVATLYKVAMDFDTELVETNPLAKTDSGEFVAADARMIVDDNALFRHPEFEGRNATRVDDTEWEAEARRNKLAYVDLDGDIGIVGNGAGLVMATMDMVNLVGGKAANFLDIGGGSAADVIRKGFVLVMSKPGVKAVLVNVLGGITRCDVVARGVVEALQEVAEKKTVVVRLMGTNEDEGRTILAGAGISVYPDMESAVKEVVRLTRS